MEIDFVCMKKLLLIAAMLLMCCITRAQAQAGSATADAAVWGYSGKDLSAVIYLPEMPANERIELTVTYNDEAAETRELFYGKKGIIHRFMELTPEVKLEYARNSAKSSSTRSLNRQNCNSLRPGFPTYME